MTGVLRCRGDRTGLCTEWRRDYPVESLVRSPVHPRALLAARELDELCAVRLYDEEDTSRIAAPGLRLLGVLDDRHQDATWLENRP
jgi:hypothetical protein